MQGNNPGETDMNSRLEYKKPRGSARIPVKGELVFGRD
jgi:hypothetical protein